MLSLAIIKIPYENQRKSPCANVVNNNESETKGRSVRAKERRKLFVVCWKQTINCIFIAPITSNKYVLYLVLFVKF